MTPNKLTILLIVLLNFTFLISPAQSIKLDTDKHKYYLEEDGKAYTKAIYDTIIHNEMMEFVYVTKTPDGYGLVSTWGSKLIPLLPNEYEEIICLYYREFAVKKNGKYALYKSTSNIDLDEKHKPFLLSKLPVFGSDFIYDKAQGMSMRARIYYDYDDKWEDFNYGAFWNKGQATIFDYTHYRNTKENKGITCDELEPINIDTQIFFKFKLAGKYGITDTQYGVQIPAECDSITHIRLMVGVSGYKDRKITTDFLVLHKNGKMSLANFTRGSYFLNYNFPIDSYHIADNTLYFTEKEKPMKMVDGHKVSLDYEFLYTDKYEISPIKKGKFYGLMYQNKVIIEPIYEDYERPSYCGWDTDVYLLKKDGYYSVFTASDRRLLHTSEKITDYDCTDVGVYVKRGDNKWYVLVDDKFHYFDRPVIGYDSIVELDRPSKGLLGYTGNRIHHYIGAADYDEVSLPYGAHHFIYVNETNGFFYKVGDKYGYNNATTTLSPMLTNLTIGEDRKKGSAYFSTQIDGKEYVFYPEDIQNNNSIKSYVDCDACLGRGFNLKGVTETRTIKGYTTVHTQRIALWRDGETYQTTTTVVPDREETVNSTEYVDCAVCSASGHKPVWLKVVGGKLVVD